MRAIFSWIELAISELEKITEIKTGAINQYQIYYS
jgi:hypothetical protein